MPLERKQVSAQGIEHIGHIYRGIKLEHPAEASEESLRRVSHVPEIKNVEFLGIELFLEAPESDALPDTWRADGHGNTSDFQAVPKARDEILLASRGKHLGCPDILGEREFLEFEPVLERGESR